MSLLKSSLGATKQSRYEIYIVCSRSCLIISIKSHHHPATVKAKTCEASHIWIVRDSYKTTQITRYINVLRKTHLNTSAAATQQLHYRLQRRYCPSWMEWYGGSSAVYQCAIFLFVGAQPRNGESFVASPLMATAIIILSVIVSLFYSNIIRTYSDLCRSVSAASTVTFVAVGLRIPGYPKLHSFTGRF